MPFSYIPKPTGGFTAVPEPTSGAQAKFGIGRFGSARFGKSDGFTQVANTRSSTSPNPPSEGITPIARPAV